MGNHCHLFSGRYKAVLVDPGEPAYLETLLDYIHLKPVRAGLVRPEEGESLLDYRWSSVPGYALKRRRKPWLSVERGMATLQLQDDPRGRKAFLKHLETIAANGEAERCGLAEVRGQTLQSTLRRGWYFRREEFREWLLENADATIGSKREGRQNYHGHSHECLSTHPESVLNARIFS